jgi:protein-S-isoprenylcysteine O-methyltransferase Ste14
MGAQVQYRRHSKQSQLEGRDRLKPSSEDRPSVIAPAPILYAVTFLVGVLLHGVFPKPILPLDIAPLTAVGLLGFGATLAVWSRRTMEGAGTNVNPSRPATTLVVTGPFGFSRNPMYVARTFLYVGLGLMVNALGILVALVPLLFVMHYGVIKREERYLEAKFGDAYRQYRARVRRWL